MSYHEPIAGYPTPVASTEYLPADPDPSSGAAIDDDEEWVNQAPKGLRIPPVTGILVLVLFAVCGFWGGAVLQKHHDKSNVTTASTAALAGAAAGRRAGAGAGPGAGAGAGAGAAGGRTFGTVSDVEGSTVFLTDAQGNIVKVNLAPSTKISKTTNGTAADIQLGQTLIVTGAKGTDGSTSAASITIAPAGTSVPGGAAGATGAPRTPAGGTGAGTGAGG